MNDTFTSLFNFTFVSIASFSKAMLNVVDTHSFSQFFLNDLKKF